MDSPDLVVLNIVLGNDAMRTHQDVALLLEQVAMKLRLRDEGDWEDLRLSDVNGNVVGKLHAE